MIGTKLAHYEVLERIGRGGMGEVYRAFDQKLHREVALKVLHEGLAGHTDQRTRILAEARAASPLNHPAIATIYEVGEQDERVFIVMELVTGTTLRESAAGQPLRVRALVRLGAQITEALQAAHERSVVHGDVKPENVVIQKDGRIKLLDFGLARQISAEAVTATMVGEVAAGQSADQVAGTLAYMAPERFRGVQDDPRSDLFSLGVLLYELAAGHRPFPGPDPSNLVRQILHDPAPRLDSSTGTVTPELARIVNKLMEKDVEARYQSARDAKVDLTNLERDLDLGPTLSAAVAGRRSVAVLPFRLLMPHREDEFLSLALADAVINGLSTSDQLLLRPLSSVVRYAKDPAEPLIAARELNVDVIVEGSIQKLGAQMRVHVQAWDAGDGSSLLSAKQDGEAGGLFELQDRISESLSKALRVKPHLQIEPPTKNPQAYELYLRAVERLSLGNRWDTRTAIEMLRSVTELDRQFADAWARLAQACLIMSFAFEPEGPWLESAEQALGRAFELDPKNVTAQTVRGRALWTPQRGFQNRPALRALEDARRLSPTSSREATLWQSLIFLHVGLLEEGRDGLTEVLAIQPDDPFTLNFLGQAFEFLGDFEMARDYQNRALALDPSQLWANLFLPSVLIHLGELDQAEGHLRTARQLLGENQMFGTLEALIWARRGESGRALEVLESAVRDTISRGHVHHAWHNAAAVHALLGRSKAAVSWLEKAADMGLPNHTLFQNDPHLDAIRNDPDFEALMARLKRDAEAFRREFGRPRPGSP